FGRDRGGSRGGFGGGRGGRGGFGHDRGEREMFDSVCSECGKNCKLPFEPKTDKPVYCSECFEKVSEANGGNSRRDAGRRSGGERNDSGLGEKIELLNVKLDKIIELLGGQKENKKSIKEEIIEESVEEMEDTPIKKALKTKKVATKKTEEKKATKKDAVKKVATKKTSKK
ncbi:MAG: hypothetical protein QMB51_00080, partial [Patescibacteria group bacterium]